ncbi:multidrug transporter [Peptoniphilus sp. GNH]|nr:multidrug transporter [Peptoniphilus sp. GNH]
MVKVRKRFFKYVIPSIMALVLFSLYSMVDGFFVANYVSEMALSAVNISLPYVSLLFAISTIFAIGAQTFCGVYLGRGEKEKADLVFSQTLFSVFFISIFFTLFCFVFSSKIASLLGARGELLSLVLEYLKIIIAFGPFFIISYNLEVLVKVDGFPNLSIIGVLGAAITNIVLDYLFVAVWSFGLRGAALATGISQVLSTVFFAWHFVFGASSLKLRPFSFDSTLLKRSCHLGIGGFISEIGFGFTVFLYNIFIIDFLGENYVPTFTVIAYISQLTAMSFAGIIQGMGPLVSKAYGKKDRKTYINLLKLGLLCVLAFSLLSIFLLETFGVNILCLFLEDDLDHILISVRALEKYSLAFLFMGYNILISGFMSALVEANKSLIINLSRSLVMIFLALKITSGIDPELIWYSSVLSEAATLLISGFLLTRTFVKNQNRDKNKENNKEKSPA